MTQEYDSDAQDEHSVELGRGSRWPRSKRRSVAAAGVAACLAAATALLVVAGMRQQSASEPLGADALNYNSDDAVQLGAAPIETELERPAKAGSVDKSAQPVLAASTPPSSSPARLEPSATPSGRPKVTRGWKPQAFPPPRRAPSRDVDDRPSRGDAPASAEPGDTGFAPSVGAATTSGSTSNPALPHTDTVNPALPNNSSGSGSSPNPALPNNNGTSSDSSSTPVLP